MKEFIIKNLLIPKFYFEESQDKLILDHFDIDLPMLIKNQVVLGNIKIKNGHIIDLFQNNNPIADHGIEIVDGNYHLLFSALTDPQVHLREPGQTHKEDLESGLKAAVKGGFLNVVTMPNTSPVVDNVNILADIYNRSNEINLARVYPSASVTLNLSGEKINNFKELKEAGAVAFTDDGLGIQNDEVICDAFMELSKLNIPFLDHAQDNSLSKGGVIHPSKLSVKFNLPSYDPKSEAIHVKRGCEMSLKYNQHYHVLHISTKESLEIIKEYKAKGARVSCEVSPHHLLLSVDSIPETYKDLDSNFKMNPPLRSADDRDACQEYLKSGVIDMIATDHAPHTKKEKSLGFKEAPFGIIGLETALPLMISNFVFEGKITLSHLDELMCCAPNKLFSIPYQGIKKGGVADFILIDLTQDIVLSENEIVSKSKNSPFYGASLRGFVWQTYKQGNLIYQR